MTGEPSRTISAGALDRPAGSGQPYDVSADRRSAAAERFAGWCGRGALAGVAGTVLIFVLLHLLPPTSAISPVTRTISEYALTSAAWAFDLGVVLLVAASLAVLGGLAVVGRIRALSVATVFGTLWAAGLLTLVGFPKHNWALGTVSSSGQIHRLASLVAFLALPIAVISLARRRGRTGPETPARWAFWLGVLSLAWFSPLVFAIVTAPLTGKPWWQAIPLGLVERGLALTAVVAAAALLIASARTGHRLRTAAPTPVR